MPPAGSLGPVSSRAQQYAATVEERRWLSDHLVRLVVQVSGGFTGTGIPDEWVAVTVPGQFQSRYYTVVSWEGPRLVLDVVVHDQGLVTEWVQGDCLGEVISLSEPRGSFAAPPDAEWLVLVGDLTALPAMARIAGSTPIGEVMIWAKVPEPVPDYLPGSVTWIPDDGPDLASVVTTMAWPAGPGYFWMAGESAQMRAIRKHLMREVGMPADRYDVMGYWRSARRASRSVEPGPIWQAGKAAGKSDEEIWADYDAAREADA